MRQTTWQRLRSFKQDCLSLIKSFGIKDLSIQKWGLESSKKYMNEMQINYVSRYLKLVEAHSVQLLSISQVVVWLSLLLLRQVSIPSLALCGGWGSQTWNKNKNKLIINSRNQNIIENKTKKPFSQQGDKNYDINGTHKSVIIRRQELWQNSNIHLMTPDRLMTPDDSQISMFRKRMK